MVVNICTASYSNIKSDKFNNQLLSISGDRGRQACYKGECLSLLAPKKEFWEVWHKKMEENPNDIENTKYYIREYYKQVLSSLNPEEVMAKIKNKILLCYEPSTEFCHRHIIAAWIELTLGKEVPEVELSSDGRLHRLERPSYIKDMLEEIMKEQLDMMNFHSIQAVLLYNKGISLENYAIRAMDDDDSAYSSQLSLLAKELLHSAESVEHKYLKEKKDLKKTM